MPRELITKNAINHERVTIVNEQNECIGESTRSEMRKQGLCHRAVYVFVFNPLGQLFVQKRTPTKDVYPGFYDLAAGGVVQAGEDYEQAAYRELAEEMGITGVPLQSYFHFYFQESELRVWGKVYICEYDGPFTLEVDEVENIVQLWPEDVLRSPHSLQFTPDSLIALQRLWPKLAIAV
ncbi:NUDIX hydrolase YfcD [Zooshikella ganghwensis]|uniref:NUDIX hydrolase YfcD n=1 Tax=Zooshikella ganghwensis TaxID=202772 RepID=UPI0003FDB8B7|nr:NUDIX hydrolase YfcD [Zooshikella ganghwensis]